MPEENMQRIGRPSVPIVLGIVGHRDLPDDERPALRTAVAKVLREFRDAYPHTPIVLLSSLASGADHLAAEVALEVAMEKGRSDRIVVRAPLPMPAPTYRRSTSFGTAEQRSAFDAMLENHLVDCFQVPLPPGLSPADEAAWETVASSPEPAARAIRHACYATAGLYVARHCHALIALWDGNEGKEFSRTAELATFALTGEPPAALPRESLEPLGYRGDRVPVIVVHTPRAGTENEAHSSGSLGSLRAGDRDVRLPAEKRPFGFSLGNVRVASPVSARLRFWLRLVTSLGIGHRHSAEEARRQRSELLQLHATCQTVDDFNADVRGAGSRLDQERLSLVDSLLAPDTRIDSQLGSRLRDIVAVRECAAYLAGVLELRLRRAQVSLFALLLIALAFFHSYAHWFAAELGHPKHQPAFLWAFLGMLALSIVLVAVVWLTRLDQRRYDYRSLAEALRVRRAWALAGLGRSIADSYLAQLRSEMTWARRALLHICPPSQAWMDAFGRLSVDERKRRLRDVKQTWVDHQVRNFHQAHETCQRSANRYRKGGFALAVAGWAMWLTPWINVYEPPAHLLILSGLLVVGGGMLIAISERRSYEELAKHYERMWLVFRNGEIELGKQLDNGDIGGAQAVILALGHEAITENAQWLVLRRSRPFELHIG